MDAVVMVVEGLTGEVVVVADEVKFDVDDDVVAEVDDDIEATVEADVVAEVSS